MKKGSKKKGSKKKTGKLTQPAKQEPTEEQILQRIGQLQATLEQLLTTDQLYAIYSIVTKNAQNGEAVGNIMVEWAQLARQFASKPRKKAPVKKSGWRPEDRWVFTDEAIVKSDFNFEWQKGEQLGQPGQYGIAYSCTNRNSGKECAVKEIDKTRFFKGMDSRHRKQYFSQFRMEIDIMQELEHDNLIKLFDVYETQDKICLVMEKCSGGELFERIQQKGTYSENDAAAVLRDLARGIEALHEKKIAHCDLKPENCLFVCEDDDSPLVLIDFGMSKYSQGGDITGIRGSTYYIAPEIITDQTYTYHCDMWSFGVITFVMLFGYPPFHSRNDDDDEIFEKIKEGFINETQEDYGNWFPESIPVSEAAKNFIAHCLESDVAKRYTATEALSDPWLTGEAASSEPLLSTVLDGLKDFSNGCRLRQAVLGEMTDLLTPQELGQLKKTFESIDEDGNGKVTKSELRHALEKQQQKGKGIEVKNIEALLTYADADGDGELDYTELLATVINRKMYLKEERIWEAFCRFDVDGDGQITIDELKTIFKNEDPKYVKQMIADVDTDGSGSLDYDEFLAMWKKQQDAKKDRLLSR